MSISNKVRNKLDDIYKLYKENETRVKISVIVVVGVIMLFYSGLYILYSGSSDSIDVGEAYSSDEPTHYVKLYYDGVVAIQNTGVRTDTLVTETGKDITLRGTEYIDPEDYYIDSDNDNYLDTATNITVTASNNCKFINPCVVWEDGLLPSIFKVSGTLSDSHTYHMEQLVTNPPQETPSFEKPIAYSSTVVFTEIPVEKTNKLQNNTISVPENHTGLKINTTEYKNVTIQTKTQSIRKITEDSYAKSTQLKQTDEVIIRNTASKATIYYTYKDLQFEKEIQIP